MLVVSQEGVESGELSLNHPLSHPQTSAVLFSVCKAANVPGCVLLFFVFLQLRVAVSGDCNRFKFLLVCLRMCLDFLVHSLHVQI